jgi:hypothetical protein
MRQKYGVIYTPKKYFFSGKKHHTIEVTLIEKMKKINKHEILKLKKETLLKIINLNDNINDIFIIDAIINKVKLINDDSEKKICDIRMMSILEDIENTKYTDKKIFE